MLSPQQRIERRAGLGASDAAAAIGLSKWETPYQLYLEKRGETRAANDDDALYLEMGTVLEPMILGRFCKKTGLTVSDRQKKFVDPNWAQRWATVDAMASDGAVVNAKSCAIADPNEWGDEFEDNAVPMDYLVQSQHEIACTGAAYCYIPLVILNRQFRIYRVRRDEELIELVTAKEREFMRCVETGTPPPFQNVDDVKLAFPAHVDGKWVTATDAIFNRFCELDGACAAFEHAKRQREELEFEIKSFMGDASDLIYCGKPLATWRQAKPSRVLDKERLQRERPEIYAAYEFERAGSRRFLRK